MNTIGTKMNTVGRIFLYMISYFMIAGLFQYIVSLVAGVEFGNLEYVETSKEQLITSCFNLLGTFLVIGLFMKFVDKERFIVGIAIGLIIMTSGYVLLIYFEEIFFINVKFNFLELIISILFFTIVAIVEETLFRGYILKNLMSSFNKYVALIVSSMLFSLMHGLNPNVTLFSLFDLFLAGILLGLSYIYTKNLWFPIAMHLSWNLFQTLLGFNVSGQDTYSIIEFKINESNLINGGAFGFEGSYLSIIAEVITIIGIGAYYNRKKRAAEPELAS